MNEGYTEIRIPAELKNRQERPVRILVISDTHGDTAVYERILQKAGNFEIAVHLGDCVFDVKPLKRLIGDKPLINVRGNCDPAYSGIPERTIQIAGVRFLMVHGHEDHVSEDLLNLYYHAMEQNAGCVLFGHTHVSLVDRMGSVWMINPGSPSRPRAGRKPSFAVVDIRDGKCFPSITTI